MFNDAITTKSVLLDNDTDGESGVVDLSLTESGDITGDVTGDVEPSETVEESFGQGFVEILFFRYITD